MPTPNKERNHKLMTLPREELYSTLSGERVVFGLLARLLYVQHDKDWLKVLVNTGVFGDIPFAGTQPDVVSGLAVLNSWCEMGMSDSLFDDLISDYARLFVVPGESFTPPWESVYFNADQMVFQEQTLQVRSWYRRFGVETEKLNNEPDDHIALELSFLGYLASNACDALGIEDHHTFKKIITAQKRFLNEHLLCWGPQWCRRVISVSQNDFYRGIALLVSGTLNELSYLFDIAADETSKKRKQSTSA